MHGKQNEHTLKAVLAWAFAIFILLDCIIVHTPIYIAILVIPAVFFVAISFSISSKTATLWWNKIFHRGRRKSSHSNISSRRYR